MQIFLLQDASQTSHLLLTFTWKNLLLQLISADHAPLQGSAPKQSTGMEEMASSGQGQGDKDEASVGRHWAGI